MYEHLKSGCKEDKARQRWDKRQQAQTKTKWVPCEHQETFFFFFNVWVTEHCHGYHKVVESSSLEILKSHLDVVLGSLL